MPRLIGLVTLAALWMSSATADNPATQPTRKLKVVATTGMVADLVRQVAGDRVEVNGLMGAGVDPHLYKPTRNDIAALQGADVIMYNGLLLEGKMTDTLLAVARKRPVFAVTEAIEDKYLLHPAGAEQHPDPHVWMDPTAWKRGAQAVTRALIERDGVNAPYYNERLQSYERELDQLHAYAEKALASIPEKQRVLITAHDAFGYFGRAYKVRVEGVQGISTESEAGLADIKRLVTLIVENDVRAVFAESSVADKNVRALLEGAGARGKTVKIGGTLFSDAMGPDGTYEGTYIGMMDHNVTTIVRALGGEAPERGMQGKLAAGGAR